MGGGLNPEEVKRTGLRGFAARHTMAQRVSRFSQQSFPSRTSFVGSVGAASSEKSDSFLHDDSDVLDLSEEEEARAKLLFHGTCRDAAAAAGTSFTSASREIGPMTFAKLVTQLTKERNGALEAEAIAEAKRRGGRVFKPALQPLPKEKDLHAAFKLADADNSGAVDEAEFLVLFKKVKAGKVAGLGGSFWNPFSSVRLSVSQQAGKSISLTEEESIKAKAVFKTACVRANQITGAAVVLLELDFDAFSECIRKLTEEANEGGMAEGGSRAVQPMPTKSDLQAAFDLADADKSGMVDEGEFVELYNQVKAGKVKGLGGGFFKSAGSLMKVVAGKFSGHEHHNAVGTSMTAQARSLREQTLEIHQWLANMGFDTDDLDCPGSPKYPGDPHTSPMSLACKNGKVRVCAWLVANGQDIHKRDMNGDTPLHLAARAGNLGVCRWLLESGAKSDICARNGRGETPMMAATRNANHAVLELLSNPRGSLANTTPPLLVKPGSPARFSTPDGRQELREVVLGKNAAFPEQTKQNYQKGWVVHGISGNPTKLHPVRPFLPNPSRQLLPTSDEAVQKHYKIMSKAYIVDDAVPKYKKNVNNSSIGVEKELGKYFGFHIKRNKRDIGKSLGRTLMKRVDADARNEAVLARRDAAVDVEPSLSSLPMRVHPRVTEQQPEQQHAFEDDDVSFGSMSSLSYAGELEGPRIL